ncbi:unnamed protein product (macronuclear) [Paramecium tetraurelia]|uniref:Uncharacterized protein n=1 Tax=Paramecium tetraurelia TaxID=5888 RepID=A0CGJ5_PARTE|nr:uncharacterized protein GSPATT00007352001 [Paramecium tetraurelia]CAK69912.1 unnamed protein product [Paramecium tetraurelia]|eukprot:XP_001437309.1 hypothetical protein (macronuclear) [Paramecium tetraurelia strain d4-2]
MFTLSLIEGLLLLIYVGILVHEYSQQQVPFYVKLLTYTSWILSFGIVFIIPHDIYYTLNDNGEGYDYAVIIWKWIYWGNFVLSWLILPICQEYEDAGEVTFKEKLIRSCKNNLIAYAYLIVLGVIFIGYLAIFNKLDFDSILKLLVALAYGFGILLVVILLGHGLVAIPRAYWRKSQYEKCLRGLYLEAAQINHAIQELYDQLINLTIEVIQHKNTNPDLTFHLFKNGQIPYEIIEEAQYKYKERSRKLEPWPEVNKRVKKKVSEYKRAKTKWEHVCSECFLLEDMIDNEFSVHYKIRSTLRYERSGFMGHYLDMFQWLWYTKIKKAYLLSLSVIFWILSSIVILSEISCFTQFDVNILRRMINMNGFFQIQISILIPLMYISFCAFYGLFHINFAGMYAFYNHQQTDAPSLLFGSINFSRVSFPLTFNFLQMIQISGTPFEDVIGNMDTSSVLGMSFSYSLPILLILASVFNFFEVYDKILQGIGLPQLKFSQVQFSSQEGERLMCRARVKRERDILNKVGINFWDQCEMRELDCQMIQIV